MSEQPEEHQPVQAVDTGLPQTDEVIASLAELDEAPLSEHVAVFERAHDQLRSTLNQAHQTPAAPSVPAPSTED